MNKESIDNIHKNDNIKITGIPTTQISQVVKDIVRSKRIMLIEVAENLGTISNSAEPNTNISKSQLSNETIPQNSSECQEQKDLNDDLGKLGIRKDNGEVRHLTKSKFDKKNTRLSKRSGANPLVESPYSTQPVLPKDAEPTAMVHKELSKDIDNQSSLVGIVNSDTLTQDEMDELAQDALLANLNETITDNTLNKAESESTHKRMKP